MMVNSLLLVDGSALSRELISRHLRALLPELQVTAVASKDEALLKLEHEQFSLVTTALMLPDADGLELCRQIRASKRHHYTPVIVISSDADERLVREGYAAGVTDYFDKSQGFVALGQFVKNFLERNMALYGRVLYIEDSRTIATLTKNILQMHGLEVTHVTSAEEGLELVGQSKREEGGCYDLVITDFYLDGEMTGGDLLYVLRARQRYSQQELPVLLITGNDDTATQVEVFRAGANDFVIKPLVEEVFIARVRALLLIKHQFDALRQQAAQLEHMAITDVLTGVRNRRYLLDEGEKFIYQAPGGWAVIGDLDHFKRINDGLGHLTGDKVLMATGALLNELFADGLCARFGGEEFVILLHGKDAPARIENLRRELELRRPADVGATISLGMAGAGDHPGIDLNTLIGLADQALYKAKDTGRNRVYLAGKDGNFCPVTAR